MQLSARIDLSEKNDRHARIFSAPVKIISNFRTDLDELSSFFREWTEVLARAVSLDDTASLVAHEFLAAGSF